MKNLFLSISVFCLVLAACNNSKSKTEFFDKAGMDTTSAQSAVTTDKAKVKDDRAAVKAALAKIKADRPMKKKHTAPNTPTTGTMTQPVQ